ncbi:hypothetical protein HY491_01315 [Candidatus Woesearchaeota archaeon]|nr:hypothetical protein [Candidatus Woesearchaeota archaeon]
MPTIDNLLGKNHPLHRKPVDDGLLAKEQKASDGEMPPSGSLATSLFPGMAARQVNQALCEEATRFHDEANMRELFGEPPRGWES